MAGVGSDTFHSDSGRELIVQKYKVSNRSQMSRDSRYIVSANDLNPIPRLQLQMKAIEALHYLKEVTQLTKLAAMHNIPHEILTKHVDSLSSPDLA